jgi:hypothetical protein
MRNQAAEPARSVGFPKAITEYQVPCVARGDQVAGEASNMGIMLGSGLKRPLPSQKPKALYINKYFK